MPYDAADEETTKAAIRARTRPQPAPTPDPDWIWTGRLRGETGSARRANIPISCRLSFLHERVIGDGSSPEFPYNEPSSARCFTCNGSRSGSMVSLSVIFAGGHCAGLPFELAGEMNAKGTIIRGRWTYRCRDCNCDGATGRFTLKRVRSE